VTDKSAPPVPHFLNAITDVVLAYCPAPKTKAEKRRADKREKAIKEKEGS
jgi:hypothetical protein